MLIKTKAKSALKMLITLFLALALTMGIYFVIPKQSTKVSAATAGSSAVLKGGNYTSNWQTLLASPITNKNIVSIRITNDDSKIIGFTKGENVADDTSENELFYYYKQADYQVDTDNDDIVDDNGYDIVIYADVETIYAPVNSACLFGNTSYSLYYGATSFYNCKSIIFDNFDTSEVLEMSDMFAYCDSLTNLNLSNFDTSNVIEMQGMFFECNRLTSLNISNFDTSNVTNMSHLFYDCFDLTNLNLSNFNTCNVNYMNDMFNGCFTLVNLNISSFNTSKVTNMSNMFMECFSLVELDLSSFNTSNVVDMSHMFYSCLALEILDIRNFDMSKVTDCPSMLFECDSLKQLIAPAVLNGLSIDLPDEYEYRDANENIQQTTTMVEGAILVPLGTLQENTSSTGVISDSILLSLIALCFVFSGFMLLKKKKVR